MTLKDSGKSANRLYSSLAQRLPRLTPWLHLILFCGGLLALDLGFRWFCRFAQAVGLLNTLKLMPFTVGWVILFAAVASFLPRLARRIYMIVLGSIFSILCVVHGIFINMFRKFFSVTDLMFAGDGAAFLDLSYLVIRKILLLWILLCLAVMILAAFLIPPRAQSRWLPGVIAAVIGIAILLITRYAILGSSNTISWDQNSDPAFLYEDFSDSRATLSMLGIYQYTFRDLQQAIPEKTSLTEDDFAAISDFAASRSHAANDMTGLLAGKNLILVQLEAIDTWMLDGYMPALRAVKENSISFSNHYTPAYITGGTFNTEFMVLSGLLPGTADAPANVYTHNEFPNSLATLFRQKGYIANSFHGSEGNIYSRDAVHANLGFEEYYSGTEMGMENYTLDSHMAAAFDTMAPAESPFFSFVITYSGHGPYGETNPIYLAHAEQAQAQALRTDGNYVYAVAHAMETDLFVQELMAYLETSGLLENTAVVFYADHYNYYMLDDPLNMEIKGVDNLNLLQRTDFFIYSKDLAPAVIDKTTSTIDVLPTLANLFGLDAEYGLLTGDDIFSDKAGYVFFNDNTWVGSDENLAAEIALRRKMNALLLNGNYWAHIS